MDSASNTDSANVAAAWLGVTALGLFVVALGVGIYFGALWLRRQSNVMAIPRDAKCRCNHIRSGHASNGMCFQSLCSCTRFLPQFELER